jgi:predicted TIM-barrel fold metal-dependent hydrolase
VLEPALPIVDCHHHLWHPHDKRYFADAFHADIEASGHRVMATVYVEGGAMLRRDGPADLRSVGEAEFVAGMAAMSASGQYGTTRLCAGFVGAADLMLGEALDGVLDALDAASGGRLRGVRGSTIWDAEPSVNSGTRPFGPPGLLRDPRFQAGIACLARRGLVYDAWQYYPQLPDVCAAADALPQATLVINHCAGLLGVGPYAKADNFERWKRLIIESARRPNLVMKIGGMAGRRTGFGYDGLSQPPTLAQVVSDWRPWVETCIEAFGAQRCMFESNFPVDRIAGDYRQVWNAFKTIAASASPAEKAALFHDNALRIYRL